ncbi:uncharacterized protein [Apostichopus japonicus]|uniref:uncharacterized protein n=1 Tax=Stichopus japonicus TaxID=307972 RepID=UPI003AB6BAF0
MSHYDNAGLAIFIVILVVVKVLIYSLCIYARGTRTYRVRRRTLVVVQHPTQTVVQGVENPMYPVAHGGWHGPYHGPHGMAPMVWHGPYPSNATPGVNPQDLPPRYEEKANTTGVCMPQENLMA